MGYCFFWPGWELWFRTYFAVRLCKVFGCFFFFCLLSFQHVFRLFCKGLLHHLAEIKSCFFCPSPLLALTLSLQKTKLMKWSYISITSFWNFLPRIILLVLPYILRVKLISLQGVAQCLSQYFRSSFLPTSKFSPCCLNCVLPFSVHTLLSLQYGSNTCKKHLKPIFCHYPFSPSYHLFTMNFFLVTVGPSQLFCGLIGCKKSVQDRKWTQKKKIKNKKKILHMPSLL